jgi:hypothetical protein
MLMSDVMLKTAICSECEKSKECVRLWAMKHPDKLLCKKCLEEALENKELSEYRFCLGWLT